MSESIELIDLEQIDEIFPERRLRLFRIGGNRIAVVRVMGRFYAFDNRCPHADYPLNEGAINHKLEIVCPWHSFKFHLVSGTEANGLCSQLKLYSVKKRNQKLILEIPNGK